MFWRNTCEWDFTKSYGSKTYIFGKPLSQPQQEQEQKQQQAITNNHHTINPQTSKQTDKQIKWIARTNEQTTTSQPQQPQQQTTTNNNKQWQTMTDNNKGPIINNQQLITNQSTTGCNRNQNHWGEAVCGFGCWICETPTRDVIEVLKSCDPRSHRPIATVFFCLGVRVWRCLFYGKL